MSNIKHKIFGGFNEGENPPQPEPETFFLLLENGGYLLLENEGKIIKENG